MDGKRNNTKLNKIEFISIGNGQEMDGWFLKWNQEDCYK